MATNGRVVLSNDERVLVTDIFRRMRAAEERVQQYVLLAEQCRSEADTAKAALQCMVGFLAPEMKSPSLDVSTMTITESPEQEGG